VLAWSGDIHVRGLVNDLSEYASVIAFGLGLLFGITFDTSGPRRVAPPVAEPTAGERDVVAADEPMARERRGFLRRPRRDRTLVEDR
jgi:hypothetical protein